MTLAQISEAPPQELLNTIAAHLRSQGAPAFNGLYRTPTGAVGCLFGDDYDPSFEGKPIRRILQSTVSDAAYLLDFLQREHDDFASNHGAVSEGFPQAMESAFSSIARTLGLTVPPAS